MTLRLKSLIIAIAAILYLAVVSGLFMTGCGGGHNLRHLVRPGHPSPHRGVPAFCRPAKRNYDPTKCAKWRLRHFRHGR